MTTHSFSGTAQPRENHDFTSRELPPLLKIGVFPPLVDKQIRSIFTLLDEQELDQNPSQATKIGGIITRSNYRISTELIDRLPNLRIITTNGVGYDGIPVDYARQKNIVVTNTPDVLNKAVAELAIGLLLALLRRIPVADQFVRTGAWAQSPFPLGTNLAGKKIGIVGLGRIGKEIVQRLVPFDVDVSYYGRRSQDVPWTHFDSLVAMATHVDVMILSCPGGKATHHLVDAAILKALGGSGVIVNIARGTVINETDLCQALEAGIIQGAALDVFESEPLDDSPLRRFSNVILSPHIGSATVETRRQMAELAIQNLVSFFQTGKAITPVVA